MPEERDFQDAGKRILQGLHGAGRIVARGGGSVLDAFTGGQFNFDDAIDTFTEGVGLAYAELDALPADSPEARYIAHVEAQRKGPAPPPPPKAGPRPSAGRAPVASVNRYGLPAALPEPNEAGSAPGPKTPVAALNRYGLPAALPEPEEPA